MDFYGLVTRNLHCHRHYHSHIESRPVLCCRSRGTTSVQRYGHGLGLDVGRVVHLDGRRAVRSGIRRSRLCDGLDGGLPSPCGISRPVSPPVRRLYHSRLSRSKIRRQLCACDRCHRSDRLFLYLPYRSGNGRRADRFTVYRFGFQYRRLRRPGRRTLSARFSAA